MLPTDPILAFIVIFLARVVDVSLGTLRMLFILQGRKWLAGLIGFFEVLIFLTAIAGVISNLGNWTLALGYAGGFSVGTVFGMFLEERFAMGNLQVRIISKSMGSAIAQAMWEAGFGATVVEGEGKDGKVELVFSIVKRRKLKRLVELCNSIDPDCFVSANDTRRMLRGYLGISVRK